MFLVEHGAVNKQVSELRELLCTAQSCESTLFASLCATVEGVQDVVTPQHQHSFSVSPYLIFDSLCSCSYVFICCCFTHVNCAHRIPTKLGILAQRAEVIAVFLKCFFFFFCEIFKLALSKYLTSPSGNSKVLSCCYEVWQR